MTGEILFAGGELDSYEIVSGAPGYNAGFSISPYSRGSVQCSTEGDIIRARCWDASSAATTVPDGATAFVHYVRTRAGTFNAYFHPLCLIRDSAGDPWLGVFPIPFTNGYVGLYYNSGTGPSPAWTQLGTNQPYNNVQAYTDDIRIALNSAGTTQIEWAIDQNQVFIGSVTRASWTNVAMVDWSSYEFGTATYYSQPLITKDISTIGGHVYASGLSGAGTNGDWSGAYGDIDEPGLSDTTNLQTANVGDVSTFATSNVTTPAGYICPSVFVWTRAKDSGLSPANLDVVIRQGGSDFNYPVASPSVSYSNIPLRMDTDTGGVDPWTDTTWNAAERGVESQT